MTITEFLLARIAEDEAANDAEVRAEVKRCRADGMPDTTAAEIREFWGGQAWWRRRLAECQAKRRTIVSLDGWLDGQVWASFADDILCALASVYADHPDYDPEWAYDGEE